MSLRLVAVALSVTAFLLPAAGASAANVTVDCTGLQTALTNAGNGDVITIQQGASCTGTVPFTTTHADLTIQGAGTGSTLGGGGAHQAWSSTSSGAITFKNLTFQHGDAANEGGLVFLDGNVTPTFDSDRFVDGHAHGLGGGAIWVASTAPTGVTTVRNSTFGSSTPADANSGVQGGALAVFGYGLSISGSTFTGNTAQGSGTNGGAVYGVLSGPLTIASTTLSANTATTTSQGFGGAVAARADSVTVTGSTVSGNSITSSVNSTSLAGGGLALTATGTSPIVLTGDTISGNTIDASAVTGDDAQGAGLSLGGQATLTGTRITGNAVLNTSGTTEGAGAALQADCGGGPQTLSLVNVVVAGNSSGGAADGALWADCPGGDSAALALDDSTVAGNSVGSGTAGVFGTAAATLAARNAILSDGVGGAFAAKDLAYSDLCASPGVAFAGTGNICADPALADAAHGDVHETAASPTIDAGSNALVPSGLTLDLDGDARVGIGTSAGNAVVDMGADERPYVAPPASPAPPAPVPVSPSPSPISHTLPSPASLKPPQLVKSQPKLTVGSGGKPVLNSGVTVKCKKGGKSCTATVTAKDGKVTAVDKKVTVKPGHQLDLKGQLSSNAQKLLDKKGQLTLKVHVTSKTGNGKTVTSDQTVTLKKPKSSGKDGTNPKPGKTKPTSGDTKPGGDKGRPTGKTQPTGTKKPAGDKDTGNTKKPTGDKDTGNTKKPTGNKDTGNTKKPTGDKSKPTGEKHPTGTDKDTGTQDSGHADSGKSTGTKPATGKPNSHKP